MDSCTQKRHTSCILAFINLNLVSCLPLPLPFCLGKRASGNKERIDTWELYLAILCNFAFFCHLNIAFNTKHLKLFMMFTVLITKHKEWVTEFSNFKENDQKCHYHQRLILKTQAQAVVCELHGCFHICTPIWVNLNEIFSSHFYSSLRLCSSHYAVKLTH